MIREAQRTLNVIRVFIDSLCILLNLCVSYFISKHLQNVGLFSILNLNYWNIILITVIIVLLHLILYKINGLYKSQRTTKFFSEISQILISNLVAYTIIIIVSIFLSFLLKIQVFVTVFFFVNTLLLILYRYALRRTLRFIRVKGYNKKYLLVLGSNDCTKNFIKKIDLNKDLGFEVLGYIEDTKQNIPINYLGGYSKLESLFRNNAIDEIVIMLRDQNKDNILESIQLCEKWGVKFSIIPNEFSIFNSNLYISSFSGIPVLNMRKIPLDNKFCSISKRLFDIIVATLCIIIFSPLILIISIIIKCTSKGPILFKQIRVGLDRRTFEMYKFRSMYLDQCNTIKMAVADDSRCTKIGNFMRKYSIDELPQLINVLKGEMSLIGPRPEIPFFVDKFKDYIPSYMIKHYIKPGMTGWAQVNGFRGNTSIPERIKYDMYYIENWSILFDIKILFLTLFKGIFNKNAY